MQLKKYVLSLSFDSLKNAFYVYTIRLVWHQRKEECGSRPVNVPLLFHSVLLEVIIWMNTGKCSLAIIEANLKFWRYFVLLLNNKTRQDLTENTDIVLCNPSRRDRSNERRVSEAKMLQKNVPRML